jgi:hypothetical protein
MWWWGGQAPSRGRDKIDKIDKKGCARARAMVGGSGNYSRQKNFFGKNDFPMQYS